MKRFLSIVLCAFSLASFGGEYDSKLSSIDSQLSTLNRELWDAVHDGVFDSIYLCWRSFERKYPQCFQDVADIETLLSGYKTMIEGLGLDDTLESFAEYLETIAENTASSSGSDYTSSLNSIKFDLDYIQWDVSMLHSEVSSWMANIADPIYSLANGTATVATEVTNFDELLDYLEDLFTEGIHVKIDDMPDVNVHVDPIEFDYSYLQDQQTFFKRSIQTYFTLPTFYRYIPSSHVYDPDSTVAIVSKTASSGGSFDFFGFFSKYFSSALSQREDISAMLARVLSNIERKEDAAELEELAESTNNSASDDADSIRTSLGFDSSDTVKHYLPSVDSSLFDETALVVDVDGSQLPQIVTIGPIPLSKINSSFSDLTIDIITDGISDFVVLARGCFTVLIYVISISIVLSILVLCFKGFIFVWDNVKDWVKF